MIQLNKRHYAVLRESVTLDSPQTQSILAGLQEKMIQSGAPNLEIAELKQLYGIVLRESEVIKLNTLFHSLSLVFSDIATDAAGKKNSNECRCDS